MEEIKDKFFSKVNKTDECWLWTGAKDKDGYGTWTNILGTTRTPRISWLLTGNTIPEGHMIRHKCRNRHCVNPDHLETGTSKDNKQDQIRDGTIARGETIGNSKLTEIEVKEIRAIRRKRNFIQGLADKYNVSHSTIREVRKMKTWVHLA